jgi:hypothetical protein
LGAREYYYRNERAGVKDKIQVTTLVIFYSATVGALYLIGFWRAFHINVFEYANVSDVLMATIFPLTIMITGILVGVFTAHAPYMGQSDYPAAPSSGKIFNAVDRGMSFFDKYKALLMALLALAASLIYNHVARPEKWLFIALFVAPFSVLLVKSESIANSIKALRDRVLVSLLIVLLPFFAIYYGAKHAQYISAGQAVYMVDPGTMPAIKGVFKNLLSYIGMAGNDIFLYDKETKRVIIVKQSDNSPIILTPNPLGKSVDDF